MIECARLILIARFIHACSSESSRPDQRSESLGVRYVHPVDRQHAAPRNGVRLICDGSIEGLTLDVEEGQKKAGHARSPA